MKRENSGVRWGAGTVRRVGIFLVATLIAACGFAAEGFEGRIFYKDGRSVAFLYLGTLDKVGEYYLSGKLGSQSVRYNLRDVGQILGPVHTGEDRVVIVVSKSGERFTVTRADIRWANTAFYYVYLDPVTGNRAQSYVSLNYDEGFSHLVVGAVSGDVKKNPVSGEYFPRFWVFDPFTGERLVWAKRGEGE